MNSKRVKLVLAMVGAGAVFAMGGLTMAFSEVNSAQQTPAAAALDLKADETSRERTGVPETSFAVPPITTAPYTIPTGEPQ